MRGQPVSGSGDAPGELPYPAPETWLSDGRYFPASVMWVTGAIAVSVGLLSVWFTATSAVLWGVVCAFLFGVLSVLSLAFGLFAVRHAPPQLINAVTLARATVRPVDDWVHFNRERPVRLWGRTWFMLCGWGTGVLLALALPEILAGPGGVWWLILFIPLLIVCFVVGLFALLQAALDAKNSSFGRVPVGVALGRHGISRYYVAGGLQHVPWESITAVEAIPRSRIRIEYGQAEPLEFTAGVFDQHSTVIYCALRFYFEHSELREEVGSTIAQRRFEAWDRALQKS